MRGYDTELTKDISTAVSIPVIASEALVITNICWT